ncbi:TetR family transcriptional regulator [Arthrobacter sp. Leaf234]|uniref:TetR family transcriptional regulator n=1 Tax=Arthrobacter sp. Leaf234 TaxID=1736303 RepID=UPI0006F82022|nr:TetR family transcriptional regulator [Arthrobacter sp. Leaf234]KQO03177.1 TetR family transcriptional regulator [Arthrobacter sp. Leaf234]
MHSTTDVRSRILLAARGEFAAYGLAGARIDRIAKSASASKERLYAHFTDKAALFQAVLDTNAAMFHHAVVLDPRDVPAFVGAVFDHAHDQPDILRMLTWARLEGVDYDLPGGSDPDVKLQALRQAQELGHIDASWAVEELLPLLFGVAQAWVQAPLAAHANARRTPLAAHRAAAVDAARRIIGSAR